MFRSHSSHPGRTVVPAPSAARPPEPLGLRRSFGFGDRLGLGLPGHLAAARRFSIAPVLAQLAPREVARSNSPAGERIGRMACAVAAAHFTRAWGADAHGVKTEADVEHMAAAGATWFTLDPSAFVENRADTLPAALLAEELAVLGKEGILPADWRAEHAGRLRDLAAGIEPAPDPDSMGRAAVKFARALHQAQRLARQVSIHSRHTPCDLELALVDCATATTPAEHLFVALEARRRGLPLTALALRWDTGIEPAAEFSGDPAAFEARMHAHASLARRLGPCKLSLHHGGDTLAILPALARACGEHLHVKTSATTLLAALRLVARIAPDLFREIAAFARTRFEAERVPHLVSTTPAEADRLFRGPGPGTLESHFLDTREGRQLLDTTGGSILHAGMTSRGRPFRDAIAEILHLYRDDHHALLDSLFTRHLELINSG